MISDAVSFADSFRQLTGSRDEGQQAVLSGAMDSGVH